MGTAVFVHLSNAQCTACGNQPEQIPGGWNNCGNAHQYFLRLWFDIWTFWFTATWLQWCSYCVNISRGHGYGCCICRYSLQRHRQTVCLIQEFSIRKEK